jgi:hypothetical protein
LAVVVNQAESILALHQLEVFVALQGRRQACVYNVETIASHAKTHFTLVAQGELQDRLGVGPQVTQPGVYTTAHLLVQTLVLQAHTVAEKTFAKAYLLVAMMAIGSNQLIPLQEKKYIHSRLSNVDLVLLGVAMHLIVLTCHYALEFHAIDNLQ